MLDTNTYCTVETGYTVLGELYPHPYTENSWFECKIEVPNPKKETGITTLHIKCLSDEGHVFEGVNRSRIYQTVAKLNPDSPEFAVDINVSGYNNQVEGAKITTPMRIF